MTQWNSHTLNQHVNAAYPPEVFGFGEQGCVPGILHPEPNPTRRFEARPFPAHQTINGTCHLSANPDLLYPSGFFQSPKKLYYP
jgi:hypothetical protein